MKLKLIANPVAGGDARRKIDRIGTCLEDAGCRVDTFLTSAGGDAARAAAEARSGGYDRIVAAGGDGTLREVVNGLVPSPVPLAFIPLGTVNVFALEVGLAFDVDAACENVLNGEARPVCVGRAGDVRFLLMAGVGFDAEVVRRASLPLKRCIGKLAYLVSAVQTLLLWPQASIEIRREDGSVIEGYGAVVGNARFYGGRFSITAEASLEEPMLHVCVFLKKGRSPLLRCALRIVSSAGLVAPDVLCFKARSLTISGPNVPVQIDGDFLGRLPMTFEVAGEELVMVLPRREAAG